MKIKRKIANRKRHEKNTRVQYLQDACNFAPITYTTLIGLNFPKIALDWGTLKWWAKKKRATPIHTYRFSLSSRSESFSASDCHPAVIECPWCHKRFSAKTSDFFLTLWHLQTVQLRVEQRSHRTSKSMLWLVWVNKNITAVTTYKTAPTNQHLLTKRFKSYGNFRKIHFSKHTVPHSLSQHKFRF